MIYSVPARVYFSFGYIAYTKALFAIVPTSLFNVLAEFFCAYFLIQQIKI